MCGIAGHISKNRNEISPESLKKMTDVIIHRGPDGEGQWISDDGTVGLGHRRLSIIDLTEAGKQPMHYLERYTITFNGEIYNYIELKEMCLKQGYRFVTQTDTEVLMAFYDWKKEECLQYFDGMFSFAIYDAKEKRIFAARDRFGEKPFYYTVLENKWLMFGSEMKVLWAAGIKREVNQRMLYNYLAFSYLENPSDLSETFFSNIYRLPHAHYIEVDTTTLRYKIRKYWDINPSNVDYSISIDQAKERFNELFYTSVSRRLRSDVPVGSSLSGGLDSSAVVAVIDRLNKNKSISQNTFSAIFPGFAKDESYYINLLLERLKVTPHFTSPDSETMLSDLGDCFYHQEEPFGSASILAQYEVMKLAKEHQVTVLLDGQGADEILAGYHPYYRYFFKELSKRNRVLYKKEVLAYMSMHGNSIINPLPAKDLKYYARKWSGPAKGILKRLYGRYEQWANPYFSESFFDEFNKQQYMFPAEAYTLNHSLYNSMNVGLTQLLRYGDRNSMAHSREVRLPFLFHEMVEFLFSLPAEFKIHEGWTKYIQRVTFEKLLPSEITWRRDKIGYEPPQKQWMQNETIKEAVINVRKEMVKEDILHSRVLNMPVEGESANIRSDNSWNHLMVSYLIGQ